MKKRNILTSVLSVIGVIVIFIAVIWCLYRLKLENQIANNSVATSTQEQNNNPATSTQATSTNTSLIKWSSTSTKLGNHDVIIKYPSIGETALEPEITVIDKSKLDPKGCNSGGYTTDTNTNMENDTMININGMNFCQSYFSDGGMSHIYYEYNNVFLSGGIYYNIRFLLSVVNGCSGLYDKPEEVSKCEARTTNVKTLLGIISQTLSTLKVK